MYLSYKKSLITNDLDKQKEKLGRIELIVFLISLLYLF